jgi:hypothetical protein
MSNISKFITAASAMMAISLVGCAFGDRHVSLAYQPVGTVRTSTTASIAVIKFQDQRRRQEIGQVRNGWGMVTAKVTIGNQDAGLWLANALADELSQAGFKVTKFTSAPESSEDIVIEGMITDIFVDMFMTYNGRIESRIVAKKGGSVLVDRVFLAQQNNVAWWGSAKEYEQVVNKAAQDLMKRILPEIVAAVEGKKQ